MLKAIWMSDLHFTHEGAVQEHDPRVRLNAAIDHINRHHHDAHHCIISGDMVNHGSEADYHALRIHLDKLVIPYLPLVGNHDDRELFRSHLPVPDGGMSDFIQYTVPTEAGIIACIDTQKTGSDAGEFSHQRIDINVLTGYARF